MRKYTAPFGYVSSGKWEGICLELMNGFKENSEQKLNRTITLEKLETILDEDSEQGRHRSVAHNRVHLECGLNTIYQKKSTNRSYLFSKFIHN